LIEETLIFTVGANPNVEDYPGAVCN